MAVRAAVCHCTPVPMMLFSIFTSVIQAYVFTLLTVVYLAGAVQAHE